MNKILLMPRAVAPRATCRWIETGEVRRPLKCVWGTGVEGVGATKGDAR